MTNLLTWPQQLSTAGTVGSDRFEIGFEPYFVIEVDGKRLINQRAQEAHGWTIATGLPNYEASIFRVDVQCGIGSVPAVSIAVTGYESGLLVRQEFPRGAPVRVLAGYNDVTGPYRERVIFKGEVLKAKMHPRFPVQATILCQGMSGKMNQPYKPGQAENIPDPVDFIESRLFNRGLRSNFTGKPVNLSTDNQQSDTLAEPMPTLMDYVNAFTESHALYWTDNGDGEVLFHFPENRFNYLNQPPINWELRQRGLTDEPDIAAPLQSWDIESLYAETPSKISFLWNKPNSRAGEVERIEHVIPGGNPDLPGRVYPIVAKNRADVEKLIKQYADDVLWQTVKGEFDLGLVGLPILPMDYVRAVNGPPGMDELYQRDMQVMSVHHVFDSRAWSVKGNVRGIFGG